MSGGRLDFGIGKGYRHNEFAGFHIPQEEAERALRGGARGHHQGVGRRASASRIKGGSGRSTTSWSSRRRRRSRIRRSGSRPAASLDPARRARAASSLILDQYASPEQHRPAHRDLSRRAGGARPAVSTRCRSRSRASSMSRRTRPKATPRWSAQALQQRAHGRRCRAGPAARPARTSFLCGQAPAATEAHTLYGTPDEICRNAGALRQAGAEYIIFAMAGGREQLRRFAREIMPGFCRHRGDRAAVQRKRANASLDAAISGIVASCHRRNPLRR